LKSIMSKKCQCLIYQEIWWHFNFKRWLPTNLQEQMRGLHGILCYVTLSSKKI
jgi:hypothetical protein